MKRILLGTTNKAKTLELTSAFESLKEHGIELVTLQNILKVMQPEETGETFEQNARDKAQFYAKKTGLPTISDDGGIMIDALNGEPGVRSRRWKGYEASDQELIDFTIAKMQKVPTEKRTAKFVTCICFYDPDKNEFICEEGKIKGHIADKPTQNYKEGYPYRALFIVDEYNKYYDELTEEEHQTINHRLQAAERLEAKIVKNLLQ